jgi:hypothetical protein
VHASYPFNNEEGTKKVKKNQYILPNKVNVETNIKGDEKWYNRNRQHANTITKNRRGRGVECVCVNG